MENDIVRRVLWTGLTTASAALASAAAYRLAEFVWRRVFGEEPPSE